MILGKLQILKASRPSDFGFWLTDGISEVLLPNKEVPEGLTHGTELESFLYRDSEDRLTATLIKPFAVLGGIAALQVVQVSDLGTWLDWGLMKHLLLPPSEQLITCVPGTKVMVMVMLDETTDRLYASMKFSHQLNKDLDSLKEGQEVLAKAWKPHQLGWTMLVEDQWQGLVYQDDLPTEPFKVGDKVTAYISRLRDDSKIDLKLSPLGFKAATEKATAVLLQALEASKGVLMLHDHSAPEEIKQALGLSKKVFKQTCGILFKEKKIWIDEDKIRLRK